MAPETGVMVVVGRMAPSSMEAAEREPKTLTLEQLNYARAALYVLRTRTPEEAMRIFTEGLVPVLQGVRNFSSSSDDDVELDSSEDYSIPPSGGRRCRQSRRPVKRDIATAPF